MRYKISLCTAGPGYAIDQTTYPFTVVKLAPELGLQRLQWYMSNTYIYTSVLKSYCNKPLPNIQSFDG